jgi:NAD+ synthase (glutamine-hydrolysing)
MERRFDSLYSHGFARVAVCLPAVRVADPRFNLARTLELARQAASRHAALAVFPELGLSAYTNDDLFQQDALLEAVEQALARLLRETAALPTLLLVGAPLRREGRLYNCAVALQRGRVLGVVPKTYLPNYREFYEKRQFSSGRVATSRELELLGARVPFGNDLLFTASGVPGLVVHAEICEDLWVPLPPSTLAALGGATVLANLSASNATIGKSDWRRLLCAAQSGKCLAAYLYAGAGPGESTTDMAWDGHALIYENGERLAESQRFSGDEQVLYADLDLERLAGDRLRMTSFIDSAADHAPAVRALRSVPFDFAAPAGPLPLRREVSRFPYVPAEPAAREARCEEVYNIQVQGLSQRLAATGVQKLVIGVSGGLDSTQALLVAARTMDKLKQPRTDILAYSLRGFATSEATVERARKLMATLGVTAHELDIRPSATQMLRDIGHPAAEGEPVYDVTFENVQAGERSSHLFRLANRHGALVLGTSDLSELALGWSTYGVGDQMSHYNVNASLPKTLVQHLIRWTIASRALGAEAGAVLQAILEAEISPELVPAGAGSAPQSTEQAVGPYELQDFHTYYVTRFGFRPSKVAFLCHHAWGDRARGAWPELLPPEQRHEYDLPTIRKWLEVFLLRFFQLSQFKRSASPNGPKIGSGGALSPRGDWRAPSDAGAAVWLDELRRNVPEQG